MQVAEDIILFEGVKNNKKNCFDVLFKKYYCELVNFAFFYVRDSALAQEIVQEVFINFWQNRAKTNIHSTVKLYLIVAVKNTALNCINSIKTRKKYESQYLENLSDDVEADNDTQKIHIVLGRAIEALPEKCRDIFELSRFDGLTYQEIADHLNISKKTVENQMGIAFKKIREFVLPYLGKD